MLSLLLLFSLAFAEDHTAYVSCPNTDTIYDGLKACPGNCVEVPPGTRMRIMKCSGGRLVFDAAKKTAYEQKLAEEALARDDRAQAIDTLEKSTNPEIRALIFLIKELNSRR